MGSTFYKNCSERLSKRDSYAIVALGSYKAIMKRQICFVAVMLLVASALQSAAATSKADLILVTYTGLYQAGTPTSSSGGVSMVTLGTYDDFQACQTAQQKTQVNFVQMEKNPEIAVPKGRPSQLAASFIGHCKVEL